MAVKAFDFPHPADKSYHGCKFGTPEWVEHRSRHIAILAETLESSEIRHIREQMEDIRDCQGWNLWPKGAPARTPKRWIELTLGKSAKEFLDAVRVLSPVEARLMSWIDEEDRKAGAENIRRGGDQSKSCNTVNAQNDQETVPAIQRRLQRRANDGDTQVADLLRQLDAGEISTDKAAKLAGLRRERISISDASPQLAAKRIAEKFGEDYAQQLEEALAARRRKS